MRMTRSSLITVLLLNFTFLFSLQKAAAQDPSTENNKIALHNTNGGITQVNVVGNVAIIEGWATSMESLPINGFRVQCLGKEYVINSSPITQLQPFSLEIWLDSKNASNLKNSLISVVPLINWESGQPLFTLYQPTLPQPTAQESLAVGGGSFEKIGLEFLGILNGRGGLKPTDSVLDVGCGLGRMAYPLTYFLDPKASYEGFDIKVDLVAKARKLITSWHPNFHFQHVDIFNTEYNPKGKLQSSTFSFPYPDNSFDFVFLTSVFTHMLPPDVSHYLLEIKRVLKPSGTCLLTCFLITKESEYLIHSGQSTIPFQIPYGPSCLVLNPQCPEAAIAYNQIALLELIGSAGLNFKANYQGSWCGRKNSYVSYQDIIVITK